MSFLSGYYLIQWIQSNHFSTLDQAAFRTKQWHISFLLCAWGCGNDQRIHTDDHKIPCIARELRFYFRLLKNFGVKFDCKQSSWCLRNTAFYIYIKFSYSSKCNNSYCYQVYDKAVSSNCTPQQTYSFEWSNQSKELMVYSEWIRRSSLSQWLLLWDRDRWPTLLPSPFLQRNSSGN